MIAPGWVLTAAHCMKNKRTSNYRVTTGEYDLGVNDKGEEEHRVEKIIVHPKYGSHGESFDIGLIKLKTETKVSICYILQVQHIYQHYICRVVCIYRIQCAEAFCLDR